MCVRAYIRTFALLAQQLHVLREQVVAVNVLRQLVLVAVLQLGGHLQAVYVLLFHGHGEVSEGQGRSAREV